MPAVRRPRVTLAQTIESQIVPRLVVRRSTPEPMPSGAAALAAVPEEAAELAELAMTGGDDEVRIRLQAAVAGQSLNAVCLDLLTPAARYLGALWDEDLCSFTDVTLGMLRLQESLHLLAMEAPDSQPEGLRRHRIALASAPGEHHRFGLSMVATFFRKAGWSVTTLDDSTLPDLAALLRREWFGVLGISVGSEPRLERLAAVLPRLRDVSRNTSLSVIVGGPIFVAHPELAVQIGADATAADGVQATWVAENLLAERSDSS
jgi:methanogenic corrinoid protein MtbC1